MNAVAAQSPKVRLSKDTEDREMGVPYTSHCCPQFLLAHKKEIAYEKELAHKKAVAQQKEKKMKANARNVYIHLHSPVVDRSP